MGRTLAVRSGRGLLSALGRPQGEYWYSRSRPTGCWPSARQSSRALRMVLTPAAGRPGGAGRRGRLGDRPIHGSRHGIARSSSSKVRGCSLTNSGSLGHRSHGPSDFRSRDRTGDVGLAGGDLDRLLDRAAAVRLLLYAVKQQSRARGCSGDKGELSYGHRRIRCRGFSRLGSGPTRCQLTPWSCATRHRACGGVSFVTSCASTFGEPRLFRLQPLGRRERAGLTVHATDRSRSRDHASFVVSARSAV
jgi:hypothetical protein